MCGGGSRKIVNGRQRGIALFLAGALVAGLGVFGVQALVGKSPSPSTAPIVTPTPTASTPTPTATPSVTPRRASPSPDPNALSDGGYPTFVRGVDVQGATVTVDVLQIFTGTAAHQAANEDGVPWNSVRYDPVYIRNENPLLRTLPVAADVRIDLIGVCETPNRTVGLTQLLKETTPFTKAFYYEVSVQSGVVTRIQQKIAIAAC